MSNRPLTTNRTPSSVLVAADDPMARSLLRSYLESHGYVVRTAASSAEVFLSIQAVMPDLVVLDPGPRLAGGELYRRLCQGQLTKHLPLLVLAAPPAVEGYAIKPGATSLVAKPIMLAALNTRVQVALQGRSATAGAFA